VSKNIEDYRAIVGNDEVNSILELVKRVKGAKIVHVNATSYGGGVAEMLKSIVPLANSIGLKAKWEVLKADSEFFKITKGIHNALQGNREVALTEDMKNYYLRVNEKNSNDLDLEADVVIIHDPQPLPLISYRRNGKWVWRCHIDISNPNPLVWKFVRNFIIKYDAIILSSEKYIREDIRGMKIFIRYPSIDPLSEKNKPLHQNEIEKVLNRYGIDPDRPIIGQVSRFDPWKDPLGVIDTFLKVKEKIPEVQLILVGSFAHDDPEGVKWYQKTVDYAKPHRDIYILTNLDGVRDYEVNALQRSLTVALQLSIREGFGLAVTEALWKGVPVVARRAGGIPLQVIDGVTGFLVNNIEEAANMVIKLIKRPWLARELGQNGFIHVKRNFLITRDLKDYLRMHIDLVGE